jgi:glycosyltransferase involved in cell wall biosynthesis
MKNILLITYYFPPCGGAAVQRWVRFLPLLVEAGFSVTVLTTNNGDFPVKDESLLSKIPESVKVIRTKTPVFGGVWKILFGKNSQVPYGCIKPSKNSSFLEKTMLWVRINLIVPDARVIWNHHAKRAAKNIIITEKTDWVVTTGPPHSTHIVGFFLKKHFSVKWIADFRDPWTQIFYLKGKSQNAIVKSINQRLEKAVVGGADKVLVVSEYIANQLPKGNKEILYNGYDKNDFTATTYNVSDKFRIKYIGQITEGQNMEEMLQFLSKFVKNKQIDNISFWFIGTQSYFSGDYSFQLEHCGFMPHNRALQEMTDADLLVLLINQYDDNQGMVTTKLFEYIASGTPILSIGPVNGEAAKVIRQAQAGFVSLELDMGVTEYLEDIYHQWITGNPVRNDRDVTQWSVQQQVGSLLNILS